jgi:hypothetical protein
MNKKTIDDLRYAVIETLLPKTQKSPYFKSCARNRYRRTKNYVSWDVLALSLAGQIVVAEEMGSKLVSKDQVLASTTVCGWIFAHEEVPIYCLEPELYKAFQVTDLPADIGKLERVLPYGVILLPNGLMKNPDGYAVDWIMFEHVLKDEVFDPIRLKKFSILGEPAEANKIRMVTVSLNGCAYSSVVELSDQLKYGDLTIADSVYRAGTNTDVDLEQRFTRKLSNLVFQFLLFLDGYPGHTDVESSEKTKVNLKAKTGGFGGGKNAPAEYQKIPIRVGVNFQAPSAPKNTYQGGTHASPRCHWRMGHTRKIRVPNEGTIREVKVRPAMVNKWNVKE